MTTHHQLTTDQLEARIRHAPLARRRTPEAHDADQFDRIVCSVATWYVEFRAGRRPLAQLDGHITPALRRRLARRSRERGPAPAVRPIVRTVVQSTRSDCVEAVALVRSGPRTTALAITLLHDGTRWWCSELTAPEDGERATGQRRTDTPA